MLFVHWSITDASVRQTGHGTRARAELGIPPELSRFFRLTSGRFAGIVTLPFASGVAVVI